MVGGPRVSDAATRTVREEVLGAAMAGKNEGECCWMACPGSLAKRRAACAHGGLAQDGQHLARVVGQPDGHHRHRVGNVQVVDLQAGVVLCTTAQVQGQLLAGRQSGRHTTTLPLLPMLPALTSHLLRIHNSNGVRRLTRRHFAHALLVDGIAVLVREALEQARKAAADLAPHLRCSEPPVAQPLLEHAWWLRPSQTGAVALLHGPICLRPCQMCSSSPAPARSTPGWGHEPPPD